MFIITRHYFLLLERLWNYIPDITKDGSFTNKKNSQNNLVLNITALNMPLFQDTDPRGPAWYVLTDSRY